MKVMLTVVYMNVVTKNTKLIKLECRERERHGRTDRNFSDGQEVERQKFNKCYFAVDFMNNSNILFLLSRFCAV